MFVGKRLGLTRTKAGRLFLHEESLPYMKETHCRVVLPDRSLKAICSNPDIWLKLGYAEPGYEGSVGYQGCRSFCDYAALHAFLFKNFPQDIQQALADLDGQQATPPLSFSEKYKRKKKLKMLGFNHALPILFERLSKRCTTEVIDVADIGGCMGLALRDLQLQYRNIRTHNFTTDPEPAMFKTDTLNFAAAEHIPEKFQDSMHLILSNMAFRYFVYPDIALHNVLQMLKNGGEAFISFSSERSHTNHEELVKRLRALFSNLAAMIQAGTIDLEMMHNNFNVPLSFFESAKEADLRIGGLMHITKLKKL